MNSFLSSGNFSLNEILFRSPICKTKEGAVLTGVRWVGCSVIPATCNPLPRPQAQRRTPGPCHPPLKPLAHLQELTLTFTFGDFEKGSFFSSNYLKKKNPIIVIETFILVLLCQAASWEETNGDFIWGDLWKV